MMAMPMARKHAAASNGATGPNPRLSASKFANSPAIIATSPLPRNMAFEKVKDSHCGSKPLCKRTRAQEYYFYRICIINTIGFDNKVHHGVTKYQIIKVKYNQKEQGM